MTDNEIVNALYSCANNKAVCVKCPFYSDMSAACIKKLINSALNLINRQKAEIERLEERNLREAMIINSETLSRVYTEARKEFAERLKDTFPNREDPRCTDDDIYTLNVIDNLLEELEGET